MNSFVSRILTAAALFAGLDTIAHAQFGDPAQVNGTPLRGLMAEPGDIDADGLPDVVIADTLGRVVWKKNLGAGVFGDPQPITELDTPIDMCLADLDGDADLDLVIVGTRTGAIVRIEWFEFLAPGEYGAAVTLSTGISGFNVEAADLDGDGDLDVLTYDRTGSEIFYFENLGGGVLATTRTLVAIDAPISVDAADLDGDGDLDIVAGVSLDSPYGFNIYENEGGGVWTQTYAPNVVFWGRYTNFSFGDLDGDGDMDIVAASGADRFDWYDQVTPMIFRNRQQFFVGVNGRSVEVGDMDLDGDLDILMFGTEIEWQENLGGGAFATHRVQETLGAGGTARLADLDGSGTLDVLYSVRYGADATNWVPNLGAGVFGPPVSLSELEMTSPDASVTADFDGDGDLDVAAISKDDNLVSAWENLGQDEFGTAVTLGTDFGGPLYDVDILTTDVDGDGDPDVVIAARGLIWYENSGSFSGAFEPGELLWDTSFRTSTIMAADIDQDGFMDLVGLGSFFREIHILFGEAGGPSGAAPALVGTGQYDPMSLAAADFDQDGDTDIAVTWEFSGQIWLIETLPNRTFAPPVGVSSGASIAYQPHTLVAADVNQDGFMDLVASARLETGWVQGRGDGTFGSPEEVVGIASSGSILSMVVTDVDGDSRLDVLVTALGINGSPDNIAWARNLGLGVFGPGGVLIPDQEVLADVVAVDFDQDLDNDLLITSRLDNRVTVLKNVDGVGEGYCAPAVPHSEGRSATILGMGTPVISNNDLTLQAFDLPLHKAGYFLASRTQGFVAQPAGSQGNLCLGGNIGRYVAQVGSTGATGTLPLIVDASALPQPMGPVGAVAGETWSFQCWFRDFVAGTSTSNFSSGFSVRFR